MKLTFIFIFSSFFQITSITGYVKLTDIDSFDQNEQVEFLKNDTLISKDSLILTTYIAYSDLNMCIDSIGAGSFDMEYKADINGKSTNKVYIPKLNDCGEKIYTICDSWADSSSFNIKSVTRRPGYTRISLDKSGLMGFIVIIYEISQDKKTVWLQTKYVNIEGFKTNAEDLIDDDINKLCKSLKDGFICNQE